MPPHRPRPHHLPTVALTLAVIVTACDNDHTGPAGLGNLAVSIATPAGVRGAVEVSGPKAYQQMVSTTQTLTHVPTGVFNILADSVVTADSVVGTRTDTGSAVTASVTVSRNDTGHASVSYGLEHRRGVLWIANDDGGALYAFGADSLRSDTVSTPLDTLSGGLDEPARMAFDPSGNMWVVNQGSDTVDMYTPAQLASNGALTPTRVISDASFSNVEALRFDPHGNMWVVNGASLYEFIPAQQSAGGAQSPTVAISSSLLSSPSDVLFDSAGNAWVSDFESNVVMKFTAAQLSTTGTPTPVDTIVATAGSLAAPAGLAYDHNGNIWVANYEGGNLVAFSPSQQATGGGVTPIVSVSPVGASTPWGIQFDVRGSLWIADFDAGTAYALTAGQLAVTGSPTPATVIQGVQGPSSVLFDPVTPTVAGSGHAARVRGLIHGHSSHGRSALGPGRGVIAR